MTRISSRLSGSSSRLCRHPSLPLQAAPSSAALVPRAPRAALLRAVRSARGFRGCIFFATASSLASTCFSARCSCAFNFGKSAARKRDVGLMTVCPHDCRWLHTVQIVWNVHVCAVHFEHVHAEHCVHAVHPVHAVQPPVQCVQSVHVHPVHPTHDGALHPPQLMNCVQSVHSVQSHVKSEQSPQSTDTKSVQSPQEMPSKSQPDPNSQLNTPQLKSHCALGEPVLPAKTVIIKSLILKAIRQPRGKEFCGRRVAHKSR